MKLLGALALFLAVFASSKGIELYELTGFGLELHYSDALQDKNSLFYQVAAKNIETKISEILKGGSIETVAVKVLEFWPSRAKSENEDESQQHRIFVKDEEADQHVESTLTLFRVQLQFEAETDFDKVKFVLRQDNHFEFLRFGTFQPSFKPKIGQQMVTRERCLNGGYENENFTCTCPTYYSGVRCEMEFCYGAANPYPSFLGRVGCSCPLGYPAPHCEPMYCTPNTDSSFDTSSHTFIVLVNTRYTMSADLKQIYYGVAKLLAYYGTEYPGYFKHYVLVAWRNVGEYGMITEFITVNPTGLLHQLETTTLGAGSCEQRNMEPLYSALSGLITPRSRVFMFVDSVASDPGFKPDIMDQVLTFDVQLYFVISNHVNMQDVCSLNMTSEGYQVYWDLARFSHGHVIHLEKSKIEDLVDTYAPTLYLADTIFTTDLDSCSYSDFKQEIWVDADKAKVTISATGSNVKVKYGYRDAKVVELPNIFKDGDLSVFEFMSTSAGKYEVYFTADAGKQCSFRIRTKSDIQFFFGYTQNQYVDSMGPTPNYKTPTIVVGHWSHFSIDDPKMMNVTFYTDPTDMKGSTIFEGQAERRHFGDDLDANFSPCKFDLSFGNLSCEIENEPYYIQVRAENVMRSYQGYCNNGKVHPFTMPVHCANGGTKDANGGCHCVSGFTGKYCQDFHCFNGGMPSANNSFCYCVPGYTGDHCEHVSCLQMTVPDFDISSRTLTLVILVRASMAEDIQQMAKGMANMVKYYNETHPGYFDEFSVTTIIETGEDMYDTNSAKFNINQTDLFVEVLGNIQSQMSFQCRQSVLNAIIKSFSREIRQRSPIFVFTDAMPASWGTGTRDVLAMNAMHRNQIYFFVTDPAKYGSCALDKSDPGYLHYGVVSQVSQGLVINLPKNNVSAAIEALSPTLYENDFILSADFDECASSPVNKSFVLEADNEVLYILATGTNLTLVVNAHTGRKLQLTEEKVAMSDLTIYKATNPAKGVYYLTLAGSLHYPCSYRVVVQSELDLFIAFTDRVVNSVTTMDPTLGHAMRLVAHVNDYTQPMGLAHAQVFHNHNNVENYTNLHSGAFRKNCSYDWYFDAQWACLNPGMPFYVTLYLETEAGDKSLQRTAAGYCVMPLECEHGGFMENGTCRCYEPYYGMRCEKPRCINGGMLDETLNQCQCKGSYVGRHCETNTCSAKNDMPGYYSEVTSPDRRPLIFVVQNTGSMYQDITAIQEAFSLFSTIAFIDSPDWISQFILVTVDDKNVNLIIETRDKKEFENALKAIVPNQLNYNCPVRLFDGIKRGLQLVANYYRPLVFVFTDSTASEDAAHTGPVFEFVQIYQAQVFFLQTAGLFPCGKLNQGLSGENETLLYELAGFSSGKVFVTRKLFVSTFMKKFMPTLYQTGIVDEISPLQNMSCATTPAKIYIPVDYEAMSFTVTAVGFMPKLKLITPNGTEFTDADLIVDDSKGTMVIAMVARDTKGMNKDLFPGVWQAEVTTRGVEGTDVGPCSLQARVSSSLQVYAGFTHDVHNDEPEMIPTITDQADPPIAVAMVSDLAAEGRRGTLEFMNMFVLGDDNKIMLNASTRFSYRAGCLFDHFSHSFECPAFKGLKSGGFIAAFSGMDRFGYTYRRMAVLGCEKQVCSPHGTMVNGVCECKENWHGDTCFSPKCLNGGTLVFAGCQCPFGFYGTHCENPIEGQPMANSAISLLDKGHPWKDTYGDPSSADYKTLASTAEKEVAAALKDYSISKPKVTAVTKGAAAVLKNVFADSFPQMTLETEFFENVPNDNAVKTSLEDYATNNNLGWDKVGVTVTPVTTTVMPTTTTQTPKQTTSTMVGTTSTMAGTTSTMAGTTSTMAGTTSTMAGTTSTMAGTTSTMGGTTSTMAGTTSTMAGTTSTMGGTTSTMAGTTSTMAGTTSTMAGTTSTMAGTTSTMAGTTSTMAGTTSTMGGTTSTMAGTTSTMAGTTSTMAGTTSTMGGTTSTMAGTTSTMAGTTSTMGGTTSTMAGTTSTMAGTTSRMAGTTSTMAETSPTPTGPTPSPQPPCDLQTPNVDIIFVLDSSSVITDSGFELSKNIARFATSGFRVANKDSFFHVALETVDAQPNTVSNLNSYASTSEATDAIKDLKYRNRDGFNLAMGLQYINLVYANPDTGYRPDAKMHMVVLFASQAAKDDPSSAAEAVRNKGFKILGIGIGNAADMGQLATVAGSSENTVGPAASVDAWNTASWIWKNICDGLGQTTSTMAGTTSTMAGTTSTMAGTTSTMAGTTSTMAGKTSTMAGTTSTMAGTTSTMAGTTSTMAGTTSTMAGTTSTTAGTTSTMAGTTSTMAGTTSTMLMTTTTIPVPPCDLTKKKYDLSFIIDDSASMTDEGFEAAKGVIDSFINALTISQTDTYFGYILVDKYANQYSGPFNKYRSTAEAQTAVKTIKYAGAKNDEFNLEIGLERVELFFINMGYRPEADNHILVVISSRSWTGADPTAKAADVRNKMNMIGIGWGPNADMAQLQQVTGGQDCVKQFSDFGHWEAVTWLWEKLCTSTSKFC